MSGFTSKRAIILGVLMLGTVLMGLVSLRFGIRGISTQGVLSALTAFDLTAADHIIVRELRVPRAIAAILAGGALGLAGALMQVLTRNPLADPGLLGVNGGAAMGVVIAIWGLGITSQSSLVLPALAGAGSAAFLVFLLGSAGRAHGPDPMRLILAGAAIGALFLAFTWSILLLSRESLDVYRFWVLGSFDRVDMADLAAIWPAYAVAFPLAIIAAFLLDPLILGDDTARALGVRVGLARAVTVLAIVGLCGTSVSLVGPIAFVGLIVPHMMRPFIGPDVRMLSLACFFGGALLALLADTLGRVLVPGREIEAGAMMALIGGPALISIVRLRRAGVAS
ncbi:MAG: iron ABC transporter permease [Pseudomonadota bacterium]